MLIKIINKDRHFAQNGPTGIRINTGTRYFAAVLLQEWYEFTRYAFWFWGVPVALWASAWAGYALGLDAHRATLRQIGWEIDQTLKRMAL